MEIKKAGRIFALTTLAAAVAACSGSSSTSVAVSNATTTSEVSLGFSDAPIGDLTSVTINVDQIIFRAGGSTITVDRFTSTDLGIDDADDFSFDLLEVQGLDNKLVIDSVDLPVGDYQDLRLVINENQSFVNAEGSNVDYELKVPSGVLKLGGFTVAETSTQTFIVEFGLAQAMTLNPASGNRDDRYILKPRGIRIVELEDASSVSGNVDLAATAGCLPLGEETIYRYAYLYEGHELDTDFLGDVFVREDDSEEPEIDPDVPANIIAPLVSTPIDGATGDYIFSYLEAGEYTVAIACQETADDPVLYDEIVVPSPVGELLEVTLASGRDYECDFPTQGGCSLVEANPE